jgi:hypothetical protein
VAQLVGRPRGEIDNHLAVRALPRAVHKLLADDEVGGEIDVQEVRRWVGRADWCGAAGVVLFDGVRRRAAEYDPGGRRRRWRLWSGGRGSTVSIRPPNRTSVSRAAVRVRLWPGIWCARG